MCKTLRGTYSLLKKINEQGIYKQLKGLKDIIVAWAKYNAFTTPTNMCMAIFWDRYRYDIHEPEKDIFKIFIFWWKGTKMTSFQFHLNMSVNKIFVLSWFYFCHYNKKVEKNSQCFQVNMQNKFYKNLCTNFKAHKIIRLIIKFKTDKFV